MKVKSVVCLPSAWRLASGLIYSRMTGLPALIPAGPFKLAEYCLPATTGNLVRVKPFMSGICGTDLALLRLDIHRKSARFASKKTGAKPHFMGHECVGVVQEVGPDATDFTVGQRVVLLPEVSCRTVGTVELCEMCLSGLPLLCTGGRHFGSFISHGGAWSGELVRPAKSFMPVPDTLENRKAVLIEPLASSLHAVFRKMPKSGQSVVVIGCGIIGLGIIASLRFLGFTGKIIALARYSHQSNVAMAMGASETCSSPLNEFKVLANSLDTSVLGRSNNSLLLHGADIVYDAVGSEQTIGMALRLTRPRGTVVLEGIGSKYRPLDTTPIWLRELSLIGAHGYSDERDNPHRCHTFSMAMQLLQSLPIAAELVTHFFSLNEYKQAILAAHNKRCSKAIKVVLNHSLS